MPKNGRPDIFVYALCDPEPPAFVVRYVGCTGQHIHHRLQAHLKEALDAGAATPKLDWIRDLIRDNKEPVVALLERVPDGQDWQAREQWWITRIGRESLLNQTRGGIGAKELHHEVRQRIARKLEGRQLSKEHRAAISRGNAGKKHTLEARASISATRKKMIAEGRLSPPKGGTAAAAKKLAGSMWITDGTQNRRVPRDSALPPGWRPGRC